jgi:hypothetical protein
MEVVITWLGGNCPVQAEGTVDGKPFYFRARGEHWSMGIGGEPVGAPEWEYEEAYGEWPAAGWMSTDEARAFIAQAVELYRQRDTDDGQPDEAQEWADYDGDC